MPFDDPAMRPIGDGRQLDAFIAEPQSDLTDAADLVELTEYQRHCFAYSAVRIHLQSITRRADITHRHAGMQIAASSLQP
jgi:hypothetical protein